MVGAVGERVLAVAGDVEADRAAVAQHRLLVDVSAAVAVAGHVDADRQRLRRRRARPRDQSRGRSERGDEVDREGVDDDVGVLGRDRGEHGAHRHGLEPRELEVPERVEVVRRRLRRDALRVRGGAGVEDARARHLPAVFVDGADDEVDEAGCVELRLDDERLVGGRFAGAAAAIVAFERPGDAAARDRRVLGAAVDERDRENHLLAAGVGERVAVGDAVEREQFGGGGAERRGERERAGERADSAGWVHFSPFAVADTTETASPRAKRVLISSPRFSAEASRTAAPSGPVTIA